jgi:radical SAM protein with 4Fe4S-binding SPASM domain
MKITSAYLEITNRCNFNCSTCYNRSGLNKKTVEMNIENIKSAISLFCSLGATGFSVAGGEPLLHSRIEELLDLTEQYKNKSFDFVTNGSIHNERFIELYIKQKNINIQVSLDGSCEEINSRTRGKDHFSRTVDFIKKLDNPNKRLRVKMVVSKYNYNDTEAFYRKVLELKAIPEFAFLSRQGNAADSWKDMCITPFEKVSIIKLINKLNKELNTTAELPLCTSKCPLSDDFENLSVCVKSDGTITPCQQLYDDFFILGNAFNFDINKFTGKLNYFSELVRRREAADYGCGHCIIKNQCRHGCMATAYSLNSDPLACDGDCDFRKQQFIRFHIADLMKEKINQY